MKFTLPCSSQGSARDSLCPAVLAQKQLLWVCCALSCSSGPLSFAAVLLSLSLFFLFLPLLDKSTGGNHSGKAQPGNPG